MVLTAGVGGDAAAGAETIEELEAERSRLLDKLRKATSLAAEARDQVRGSPAWCCEGGTPRWHPHPPHPSEGTLRGSHLQVAASSNARVDLVAVLQVTGPAPVPPAVMIDLWA